MPNDAILVALITGGLSAFASVITVIITSDANNKLQDERIKTLTDLIGKLQTKVEAHNNFGLQIAKLETRVDDIEKRIN